MLIVDGAGQDQLMAISATVKAKVTLPLSTVTMSSLFNTLIFERDMSF